MSEREYWISFWKITAVCFLTLVISGVTSCQMTREKIVRMVEAGADPMEAACSIDSGGSNTCHLIIAIDKASR